MVYSMIGIDGQIDFGFGITAEAYFKAAECLEKNKNGIEVVQLKEMPINFLYRHSIELALKSLIIIFHKKLKINYGEEPFDSHSPKIMVNDKIKKLYGEHKIAVLYGYWLNNLLLPNIIWLRNNAKHGEWEENKEISELIPLIETYDNKSSFFRYPVTQNTKFDLEKFEMQPMDMEKLVEIFNGNADMDKKESSNKVIMAFKNDNGEIIKAYSNENSSLDPLIEALKKIAYYFYCIHIMTRITLCRMS